MYEKPECRKCGKKVWKPIPDSLAYYCECCGEVIVERNSLWEYGASIPEWIKDVYGDKNG